MGGGCGDLPLRYIPFGCGSGTGIKIGGDNEE